MGISRALCYFKAMDSQILLMVDPVGDQIFPVSSRAFSVITAPRDRVLARNCVALFLDRNGKVWRIEGIEPMERGVWAKLRPWLEMPVPAEYQLVEVVDENLLEDMQTMILDAVAYTRERHGIEPDEWWAMTAPIDEVRAEVSGADSLSDLYARIRFPADEECLDLL